MSDEDDYRWHSTASLYEETSAEPFDLREDGPELTVALLTIALAWLLWIYVGVVVALVGSVFIHATLYHIIEYYDRD